MKQEPSSRRRNEPKRNCVDFTTNFGLQRSLSGDYISEGEESVSDSGSSSEEVMHIDRRDCEPSMYQRAAEHIITQRALPRQWFKRSPSVEEEIQELGKLVDGLLKMYDEYFSTVVEREPWTEKRGVTDFKKIAKEVLNRDEDQANWTRIAMLLALATRVARHFHQQGSSREYVSSFSRAVGSCIEERVSTWDQNGDRWEQLRQDATLKSYNKFTPLFGAGAVVFSFLAVVTQFTMTSPVFINKLKT